MGRNAIILTVILTLLLIATLPKWPHSKKWGYYPSGALIFLIFIIWLVVRHN
jgi:asparagine N-glycosylation enzyme membrane subunit Stt3